MWRKETEAIGPPITARTPVIELPRMLFAGDKRGNEKTPINIGAQFRAGSLVGEKIKYNKIKRTYRLRAGALAPAANCLCSFFAGERIFFRRTSVDA